MCLNLLYHNKGHLIQEGSCSLTFTYKFWQTENWFKKKLHISLHTNQRCTQWILTVHDLWFQMVFMKCMDHEFQGLLVKTTKLNGSRVYFLSHYLGQISQIFEESNEISFGLKACEFARIMNHKVMKSEDSLIKHSIM